MTFCRAMAGACQTSSLSFGRSSCAVRSFHFALPSPAAGVVARGSPASFPLPAALRKFTPRWCQIQRNGSGSMWYPSFRRGAAFWSPGRSVRSHSAECFPPAAKRLPVSVCPASARCVCWALSAPPGMACRPLDETKRPKNFFQKICVFCARQHRRP